MSYIQRLLNNLSKDNSAGMNNESTRQKWIQSNLKSLPADLRLLDAGAGEQQYKKYCAHLHYVSQDFAQYDGLGDNTGLQQGKWNNSNLDIVSDISEIPEPDASFDVILCSEVFEHLPNPVLAIKEFSRLLKKGGQLLITAPFCSLTHFAPYHYSTGFNRYFYETHLANNGFEIRSMECNGNYFEFIAQELRRIEEVGHKYARKSPDTFQRILVAGMLRILNKMSKRDSGSSELLHFGYHVHAIKK